MKKLFLIFLICSLASASGQVVTTTFGQIQGVANGGVLQFLGIPFAKPPIDTLRWKPPIAPDNWTGILVADEFAPVCPQKKFDQGGATDTIIGNEDCLYLNIWTPQTVNPALPVMVFIHGGGNQQGSASEINGGTEMYFGKNMAERGNAVVVTLQYRLGPLGFLVHPGLEPENPAGVSGNYAIMDLILALNWIQNNIDAFGGDAGKVMIFGESAGGVNVGNLILTPAASGLFQRAVIQSAGPVLNDYNSARNDGIAYVDSFIASGNDIQKISFMRSLPSDSLVKYETPPLSGGAVGMNWVSVVDSILFFDFPYQSIQSGNFNHVPLIVGSNSEEMSLSVPPTVFPFMVSALINNLVPAALQPQALSLYPPGTTNAEARESYIGILSDAQFTATARRVAQCVSANQSAPVFRYFFTHKHAFSPLTELGSYHGMELFYVFNNWENATLGSGPLFSVQDDSVQNVMLSYWVQFASNGDPNSGSLPSWPVYQGSTDCYLEIKATPDGSQCGVRTAATNLWDDVVGFIGCTPSAIADEALGLDAHVFPNPGTGIYNVRWPKKEIMGDISVYNIHGIPFLQMKQTSQIDLSQFARGVYSAKLEYHGSVRMVKLILIN